MRKNRKANDNEPNLHCVDKIVKEIKRVLSSLIRSPLINLCLTFDQKIVIVCNIAH